MSARVGPSPRAPGSREEAPGGPGPSEGLVSSMCFFPREPGRAGDRLRRPPRRQASRFCTLRKVLVFLNLSKLVLEAPAWARPPSPRSNVPRVPHSDFGEPWESGEWGRLPLLPPRLPAQQRACGTSEPHLVLPSVGLWDSGSTETGRQGGSSPCRCPTPARGCSPWPSGHGILRSPPVPARGPDSPVLRAACSRGGRAWGGFRHGGLQDSGTMGPCCGRFSPALPSQEGHQRPRTPRGNPGAQGMA